ncbi:hypothetical protein [Flavivirga spongiicola]|uniref:Arylsulfotransferase ASST n=1 Tax=Flavivirga spongiicola TaxID=421621 RepID=A0ABU7XZU8_9FLAO|nr:hypothetical protein [Flavivirga sp. MEBiC05379]MDO5981122.1 hypothetical protein [Flavivirga sp. MEBiC05379]
MIHNIKVSVVVCIVYSFLICSCSTTKSNYYIGGSGWKEIALVDNQGTKLWSHQLEEGQECNSVNQFSKGKVLYSFRQGAKLIDQNHQVLWEYLCDESSEVQSASLTDEGNILLGICGNPAKLLEFSSDGEKIVDISFETGIKNPHGQFRKISKTANGNYLVPLLGKKLVFEIDARGKVVRQVKTGIFVFSLVVLKSGNWLLSCGDTHKMREINPNTGAVVWELKEHDLAGVPLRFVAEAIRLKNGNTIICNWGGHAGDEKKVAQVFEIDADKNLIWKIEDYKNFGNVSTLDMESFPKYKR